MPRGFIDGVILYKKQVIALMTPQSPESFNFLMSVTAMNVPKRLSDYDKESKTLSTSCILTFS